MKIALIGATGFIGSGLLKEILARGHQVTALVAHPEKLTASPHLSPVASDVRDPARLTAQLKGHDTVISAFSGHAQSNTYDYYMEGMRAIIAAARQADIPRLLVVGGAGSLEVAPGVQVIDSPQFPAEWRASAEGARDALKLLHEEPHLNWTMLSPAAVIAPGTRSGKFRLGADKLVVDEQGESRISVEDYAVAMIDELEKPAHARRRFTVAY